jgi:putative pyruvate formate lyase activating enzyme
LAESGQLQERIEAAMALLSPCELCPRACGVDRLADEQGFCGTGRRARVASFNAHFGEERPLVGTHGSGTIFFSGCNLGCMFCQNYDISHFAHGREFTAAQLAAGMIQLQDAGCHNINLVTPTHVVPQILAALVLAIEAGLVVPLVYNCGGYESLEVLRLLDGVIDIYMPDAKYADSSVAAELSDAPDYPDHMYRALTEMYRQVGDLRINAEGIAERGLLVRHLVLPDDLAGTARIMEFVASLSPATYVNIMDQYHPCHEAVGHSVLGRRITSSEYAAAVNAALDAGLTRLDDRVRM